MKVGDKIYRYNFDLGSGKKSVDVFEVSEVLYRGKIWERFKCAPTEGRKLALQGVLFGYDEFGKVKTKGTSKYVMLDHEGEEEALSLVLEYVGEKLLELQEKVDRARHWMEVLESWAKGAGE